MKSYQSIYQLFILLIIFSANFVVQAKELLLTNANIIDPQTEQIRQGHLLIENKTIIATLQKIPENFTGQIIDVKDKWIIPGLNELHTHSFGNRGPGGAGNFVGTSGTAKLMLSAGVTSLLDLFGNEDKLFEHRKQQQAGETSGADIFTSLSCLTATKGHCTEYGVPTRVMDSPEQAINVVNDLAKRSPDVIKIVYSQHGRLPSIDKATLKAAIDTAKKHQIKTIIHISSVDDMRDAILAGASALTHIPDDKEVPLSIAQLMVKHNVVSIPTLSVDTDLVDFIKYPEILATPMAVKLANEQIRSSYKLENLKWTSAKLDELQNRSQHYYRSVTTLIDAGVTILTGSDSGNYGTIQGYSVHREMIKLVQSGMNTWQALQASTTNAGKFLGKNFGVNAGDEANLVILQDSPINDIKNTQKIAFVIHHGKVIQSFLSQ
jgi:imidazolonepropionase-like amidohydrolase